MQKGKRPEKATIWKVGARHALLLLNTSWLRGKGGAESPLPLAPYPFPSPIKVGSANPEKYCPHPYSN